MTEKVAVENNGFSLSPNARLVLEKRYLKKDVAGRPVESPEDMFRRIAKNIASVDLVIQWLPSGGLSFRLGAMVGCVHTHACCLQNLQR